jgi:hypothetical protein
MLEIQNTDGFTVSINPRNLVQLLYIDRHTSGSGTSIYCNKFEFEAAETAESLAARAAAQARIVSFNLFVDGKVSIPTWFNADTVVAVRQTTTGHCVILAETGSSTLVAETYAQVVAALGSAKLMSLRAKATLSRASARGKTASTARTKTAKTAPRGRSRK